MSRVIKCAVLHNDPKIIDLPRRLSLDEVQVGDETIESDSAEIAEHSGAAIIEEYRQKAQLLIDEAEQEQKRLLAAAQAEANTMIATAESQVETWQQEAHAKGQEQGYQDGFALGKTEGSDAVRTEMAAAIAEANDKAMRVLQLATEQQQETLAQSEGKMIELVLAIADKVIPEHFIDAPQVILPLIKKALEKVKDQKSLVVRVSEDNYEFVLLAKHQLQMIVDGDETLKIVADPLLGSGDCMIESANGTVDARLTTQLESVKKAIQEVIN